MGTISLPERFITPPSQVAAVRPRELPAEEGSTLGVVAELVGDFFDSADFDKVRKSRAANEQSEFLGKVDSALAEYEATIAENPGMTQEELVKLKEATKTKINSFGNLATLPESKQYIKNFSLKNLDKLEFKLDESAANIITQQETVRFNELTASAIRDMNPDVLAKLYDDTGLFDPDTNLAMFKNDMSKLEQRVLVEQRRQAAEARAEAGRARAAASRAATAQKAAAKAAEAAALSAFEGALTDIALGTPAPQPTTQAEYNTIPSGTEFVDTDGKRKVKK